jgi:large subunit ribosomal protein L25
MERPALSADVREGTGKGVARKLRAKGLVPGIFYGARTETIPVVVNPKELARSLQTEAGENVLIDFTIRKGEEANQKVVMVKEVQTDPLQGTALHADFYEISMDELIVVEVPIHLVGRPEGVKMGGILEQVRRTVQIQCLPGDIPRSLDVDVSALMIGDSAHGSDLRVENAKILMDPAMTIATVVPPAAEEKKAEEVVTEAAEAAEPKEEKKEEEK